MASIEFIQKRIEGKEKELAKLEKKMERIRKAEASNWENNPYCYSNWDIERTERDIRRTQKELTAYQEQLTAETEKANSRNIPAILEFLANWKAKVKEYYRESFPKYLEDRAEWYKKDKAHCDWHNHGDAWQMRRDNPDEYNRIEKEHRKARAAFEAKWKWITPYIERNQLNEVKLQKDLDKDADAKYDFIIERTNAIVGTITDATNLEVGFKGDLNGYIIGERGTAKVETIGAGGYNIQCFHFRTLINRMK